MSTRSRIGYQNEDGTVRSVYCHSDGYPEHNGAILVEAYTDPAKINELLDLGDISCLGPNIGEKHDFDWMSKYFGSGSVGNYQDDPCYEMVKAYGRDRGEQNVEAKVDTDAEAMYKRASEGWEEYAYLFRDGQWYVSPVGGGCGPLMVKRDDPDGTGPSRWQLVTDVLAAEEEDAA